MNQPPEYREAALKDTIFPSRITRRKINLKNSASMLDEEKVGIRLHEGVIDFLEKIISTRLFLVE